MAAEHVVPGQKPADSDLTVDRSAAQEPQPGTSGSATDAPNSPSGAQRWLVLLAMCLTTLALMMDNLVLNLAIPAISTQLGAGNQEIQWILASYILVFAGLLLPAGGLADRFGRRRMLLIGLTIFGLTSTAGAWAPTSELLIAARFGMGVGGALMFPCVMAILIVTFPDEQERRIAMGSFAVCSLIGMVGGPLVGGLIIEHFWWGAVLLFNLPFVAIAVIAAVTLLPESRGPRRRSDPIGALLSVIWTTAVVWAIIKLPDGFGGPVIAGVVLGITALAAFVWWERRVAEPMVPLSLFADRNFSGSCFSIVIVQFAVGGAMLLLTQYLQLVLGFSPLKAGLALLPMAVAMVAVQPIGAWIGKRFGQRWALIAGLLVIAGAIGWLTTMAIDASFWSVGTPLALAGVGSGLAGPAAMTILTGAIPPEHAGVGSALNDTMLETGAALGIAAMGSMLSALFSVRLPVDAPDSARASLADALIAAGSASDPGLALAARQAFTDAMSTTLLISAALILAGALLAALVIKPSQRVGQPTEGPGELPGGTADVSPAALGR